jgi:hypothetical protein
MFRPTTSDARSGRPWHWFPARSRAAVATTIALLTLPILALVIVRPIVEGNQRTLRFVFTPVADWYVNAAQPTRAFNGRWLRTSGAAAHSTRSYLRFRIDGLRGAITGVTLRVRADSGNRGGFLVAAVAADAWTGRAVPYKDAPAPGPVVGHSGPVERPGWVSADLDLTPSRKGPLMVALVPASTASTRYLSGDVSGSAPQLEIRTVSGRGAQNQARVARSGAASSAAGGVGRDGSVRVVAAGDIACDPTKPPETDEGPTVGPTCMHKATSDLALSLRPDAVLPLGDGAYSNGTLAKYQKSYQPTWGRLDRISHPVPGNHEYIASAESIDAAGYFAYFGASAGNVGAGWYSFDLGRWHLVALNGQCAAVGGCGPGSPQERWLRADLAAHARDACVLAYWHEPRFSSGQHGNNVQYAAFWQDLYQAGAELVLNGHDHDYERFAPQTPSGQADPARGLREFVVGTGGASLRLFKQAQPNSEVRGNQSYGLLQLELHPNGYDWRFVPAAGGSFTDAGSGTCH